jgi:hypothetical protein
VECDYWPVDEEKIRRELEARLERRQVEIRSRLERVERRWREGEDERRREWEALGGRLMDAYEENRHFNDGLLRKMTVMTEEYIRILREGGAIFQQEMAEGRAQLRANTEAVLQALDRLPPRTN